MPQPVIELKNLTKTFGTGFPPALDKINAVMEKGTITGIVGPDGAGKSTLMRLMAAIMLPSEGQITVAGYDTVSSPESIHRIIGYMPQKFGLYEDLTVMENLDLYADIRGVLGEERKKSLEKILHFTALAPFKGRLSGALSGGMKQKLGLACALIKKPEVLLLDEPSVGVDPISRRELWQMVYQLIQEGVSVVWSTAYLDEAERCRTVLVLGEGKLLYSGAPEILCRRVEHRTFTLSSLEKRKQRVLKDTLNNPSVVDGIIQGNEIRIVLREGSPPLDAVSLGGGSHSTLAPAKPRFEDGFIDMLGGVPGGNSLLADQIPVMQPKAEAVIIAESLTKRFGNFTAADSISFEIKSGEIFGLLGPNGAGKSTTFKMLCGLLTPTSGKSFVNGINLQKAPGEARSHIGYMAQKFSLYGYLSVSQNLSFFSGIYSLQGKHRAQMIDKMIETFSLQPFLDTQADLLPLGYKQRLALSCAVMHAPQVLFLDEPTSGVDPLTRREFWKHINGLVEKGVTVMITTHFMDEAEYCDRIGLVYRSKLIRMGTPDSLKMEASTPSNPSPTLEEAFIQLIEEYDKEAGHV